MITSYNEFRFCVDALNGNICRMCVTTDEKELSDMRHCAEKCLVELFEYRSKQICN